MSQSGLPSSVGFTQVRTTCSSAILANDEGTTLGLLVGESANKKLTPLYSLLAVIGKKV